MLAAGELHLPDSELKKAARAIFKRRGRAVELQPQSVADKSISCPDGADRLEAALARRLDRITRQMELIERQVTISNEALAAFVRFWLTSTPALPDTAFAAAQAKGRERYDGFVEALGRRHVAEGGPQGNEDQHK
jgi:hypothetical protein